MVMGLGVSGTDSSSKAVSDLDHEGVHPTPDEEFFGHGQGVGSPKSPHFAIAPLAHLPRFVNVLERRNTS
ncbi:hypothetical protein GWI33_006315 [Rhynchophorus ferrugineus]|uniref:Uncharacterized protein n=1 Tax=Rhynchophorus ferrugineus TaxID=354439 RepID=A0A834IHV8_RHYFE|nr:hypothetical protein GWI33_006315 [Rhynchophorus ferrugineus]